MRGSTGGSPPRPPPGATPACCASARAWPPWPASGTTRRWPGNTAYQRNLSQDEPNRLGLAEELADTLFQRSALGHPEAGDEAARLLAVFEARGCLTPRASSLLRRPRQGA